MEPEASREGKASKFLEDKTRIGVFRNFLKLEEGKEEGKYKGFGKERDWDEEKEGRGEK